MVIKGMKEVILDVELMFVVFENKYKQLTIQVNTINELRPCLKCALSVCMYVCMCIYIYMCVCVCVISRFILDAHL